MRLKYVELSGFRGYRNLVRIEFGCDFTVIDGRNGVGKSTVFDAIEFALTGTIAKYSDAKADGESVDNYIWWRGSNPGPEERYVKVGFDQNGTIIEVTRTSLRPDEPENLSYIVRLLCDDNISPEFALPQLCKSSIIRDELIAKLSLDLKETERFSLVSSAIGATGSDAWSEKTKLLVKLAKAELQRAEDNAQNSLASRAQAAVTVDEARASLLSERDFRNAVSQLQSLLNGKVAPDGLVVAGRDEIAKERASIASLRTLIELDEKRRSAEDDLLVFESQIAELSKTGRSLVIDLEDLALKLASTTQDASFSDHANELAQLAAVGEAVGCVDNECPLCNSKISQQQFADGLRNLREEAIRLEGEAVRIAGLKRQYEDGLRSRSRIEAEIQSLIKSRTERQEVVREFKAKSSTLLLDQAFTRNDIDARIANAEARIQSILKLLPLVDSAGRNSQLLRTEAVLAREQSSVIEAEKRLADARRSEMNAQSLSKAVKRAAGETVTLRLERILPLITELYERLRPHQDFKKIDFKIRGEIRRHLTFRVGDDVNPQFVFSSGQRRATGLAFLIAVHLSIAWSKWESLMLDDPVQHIDDFRSVHLAEMLGHLVSEGRQVICAVEDAALADLICRKMPVKSDRSGKRITLGQNDVGDVDVVSDDSLVKNPTRVLFSETTNLAVS